MAPGSPEPGGGLRNNSESSRSRSRDQGKVVVGTRILRKGQKKGPLPKQAGCWRPMTDVRNSQLLLKVGIGEWKSGR